MGSQCWQIARISRRRNLDSGERNDENEEKEREVPEARNQTAAS